MWKRPFLLHDLESLDQRFYSIYDERFVFRKVELLYKALQSPELLRGIARDATERESDVARHGLAAEILFSEFHQFEAFMAMLSAPFQTLAHWLFLSTYTTKEIKKRAEMFANRDYFSFSNGRFRDRDTVLRISVYDGLVEEPPDQEKWQSTFENLAWMISRLAIRYLDAEEYNSYKHGLRLFSSDYKIAFGDSRGDFTNAFVLREDYAITHLKLKPVPQGTSVRIATKAYNPDESKVNVSFMADVLANMKRSRLAVPTEENCARITLLTNIDKEKIVRLARGTRSETQA
jgi:hypothetical protein